MGVSSLEGQGSGLSQPWLTSAMCLGKEQTSKRPRMLLAVLCSSAVVV